MWQFWATWLARVIQVFAGGLDKGSLIWMNDGKGRFRKR